MPTISERVGTAIAGTAPAFMRANVDAAAARGQRFVAQITDAGLDVVDGDITEATPEALAVLRDMLTRREDRGAALLAQLGPEVIRIGNANVDARVARTLTILADAGATVVTR